MLPFVVVLTIQRALQACADIPTVGTTSSTRRDNSSAVWTYIQLLIFPNYVKSDEDEALIYLQDDQEQWKSLGSGLCCCYVKISL